MFVCLSAFYWPHDICPLCGAASEWPRESRSRRGRPRATGQACTARARARMLYNFSTNNSYAEAPFKNKTVRAHAVVYVTAEIFKKGKKKTNMPPPKFSLQFAFSWSLYFSNRTECPWFNLICNFTFSYLIISKTFGRKRLRTWSLVGADLSQLVWVYSSNNQPRM